MNKVLILTDSTCDLTKQYVKDNDVYVLPLYVNFSFGSFKDMLDIDVDKLYKLVNEKKEMPKTSAITVFDFKEFFDKYLELGYDIVYTGISSFMSSTYQNAVIAAEENLNKRIFIVDSKNLSTGIGLLILKMVKFRDEGLSAKEIFDKANEIVPRIRSQFAIKKLEYLYKGGRCNAITAFVGSVLNIKPIITVRDGKMSVGKKSVGKMKKALDMQLEMFFKDINNIDLDCVMITHSKADMDAKYMILKIKEKIDCPIMETNAGCVISSHCGEGTIGVLYILKKQA